MSAIGRVTIELSGVSKDQMIEVTAWLADQLDELNRNGILLSGVEDNFGEGVKVESIVGEVSE